MVRITEELVRKRAEHNECIIGTLEELSLHQEDIEKIEHLQNWCKELQILYLQANLISRIENLHKLKKLQYLNLAVNNIEVIENLERCESLEKLDLTLNFIGNIESVSSLTNNVHLKHLYLTGNPCCDFKGYREYVIVKLPYLQNLDVTEVTRSERIKAQQNFDEIRKNILTAQDNYSLFREEQRERLRNGKSHLDDDEFWKSSSENAPETRVEISQRSKAKGEDKKEEPVKKSVSLFNKDGRPLNINQAKLDFTFSDENPEEYVLDVAIYKYLDTNLIDVDLQPIYVRISVKGKIFQIVFPEEIQIDKCNAQRSQTTGHLVLKMPRLNFIPKKKKLLFEDDPNEVTSEKIRHEYLEVEPEKKIDIFNIVEQNQKSKFEDNPDVPPLEYG